MLTNKKGFTLIEIMVVVGIVVVIFTLALPIMLRQRLQGNEVAAIGHCRLIASACQSYYTNILPHAYPVRATDLIQPVSNPPYIDSSLASGEKQGYRFTYTRVSVDSFFVRANPRAAGRTGTRYFYVDETGVIRANSSGPAGPSDPPVSG